MTSRGRVVRMICYLRAGLVGLQLLTAVGAGWWAAEYLGRGDPVGALLMAGAAGALVWWSVRDAQRWRRYGFSGDWTGGTDDEGRTVEPQGPGAD